MSSTLLAPQRLASQALDHPRSTTLPNRIALRIALWLLLWSIRPTPPRPSHAEQRTRAQREHDWLRQRLHLPH